MDKLQLTSTITFLYFRDLENAKRFFTEVLGLKSVFDPGWACVYRLGEKAFIGAVDEGSGSIEVKAHGGVLVSLTVSDIDEAHARMRAAGAEDLSDIRTVKDIALKSFFFTGPEGYRFEVQQFTAGELSELF